MKRLKLTILFIVAGLLSFTSCDNGFEDLNTDPDRIETISQGSLLSPVLYEVGCFNYERANGFTLHIMQDILTYPSTGTDVGHYYLTESSGNSTWNTYYKWLNSVKEMYTIAVEKEDVNYQAIALTLNSWMYANLADCFGDVPMEEACRAEEGVLQPAFNTQKEVYTQILADLETANTLFDTSSRLAFVGDLIYSADSNSEGILKWKKFCNSLRLRLLLRLYKRDSEMQVTTELKKMLNSPDMYPIFESRSDEALLNLTGVTPLISPIARPQDFTTGRAAGEFLVENLKQMEDPRLSIFFSQARDLESNTIGYQGIPCGYVVGNTYNYTPSNIVQALAIAPMDIIFMSYAEVQFILAELAFRSIISGNAQDYYEEGVRAAVELWGGQLPGTYFENSYTAYDNTLERIMLQKYIALFFVDYQQWFEYRRTGLPVLPNNGGLHNNGVMPVRFQYTPTVARMNKENYEKAVANMGGDDINTKTWWEK